MWYRKKAFAHDHSKILPHWVFNVFKPLVFIKNLKMIDGCNLNFSSPTIRSNRDQYFHGWVSISTNISDLACWELKMTSALLEIKSFSLRKDVSFIRTFVIVIFLISTRTSYIYKKF